MNTENSRKSVGRPITIIDIVLWLLLIQAFIWIVVGYYWLLGVLGILIGVILGYVFCFVAYHFVMVMLVNLVRKLGWDKLAQRKD